MKLIEIHSERPHSIHCEICDSNSVVNATKWYETEREFSSPIKHTRRVTVLECCKYRGNVVDWEERIYEEYK